MSSIRKDGIPKGSRVTWKNNSTSTVSSVSTVSNVRQVIPPPEKTTMSSIDVYGTKPITIIGKVFNIGFSEYDNLRRIAYFNGSSLHNPELTRDEKNLLKELQFTKPLEIQFRHQLAEFFQQLESCNTDASIFLRNNCQHTQLLLWNLQFAIQSRNNLIKRAKHAFDTEYSAEDAAMNRAIINELRKPGLPTIPIIPASTTPAPAPAPAPALPPIQEESTEGDCLQYLMTLRSLSILPV